MIIKFKLNDQLVVQDMTGSSTGSRIYMYCTTAVHTGASTGASTGMYFKTHVVSATTAVVILGSSRISKMYQYQILQVLYNYCAKTTTYRLLAGLRPMCDFPENSGLSL